LQKTKAPRSARGAQKHPHAFANIMNDLTYGASNAIGELSHSTAAGRIGCREQERPQLATPAGCHVDRI